MEENKSFKDTGFVDFNIKPAAKPKPKWYNQVFVVLAVIGLVAAGWVIDDLSRKNRALARQILGYEDQVAAYEARIEKLRADYNSAARFANYAQRFISLDAEAKQYVKAFDEECAHNPIWDKKRCDKLNYKIDRYNREIRKINKIYEDGGWVEDPNVK